MKTKKFKSTSKKGASKNVYQMITDIIIEKLEKGEVMWKKPWKATQGLAPMNIASKTYYKGFNAFLLGTQNFEFPYFLTCKQAMEMGGHVTKGEKGFPVIYWSMLYFDADGKKVYNENEAFKIIPLLKYYTVFNISQISGVEFEFETPAVVEVNTLEICEDIIAQMPNKPLIYHNGGDSAFYTPALDTVQMPKAMDFHSIEDYYSTLFHELTHSTGHRSRLAREGVVNASKSNQDQYSKEELIAEFGASFLNAIAGNSITTIDNSAAYIKGWIKVLKNDNTLLISAASQAQKAVEFITNKIQVKDIAA